MTELVGLQDYGTLGGIIRTHCWNNWPTTNVSFFAQVLPRPAASTSLAVTVGTLYLTGGLVLQPADTVNSITYFSGASTATGLTHQWFCLVNAQTLAVLAVTSDDLSTAWAVNAFKTLNLTSAYTAKTITPIYIGIMVAAGSGQPVLGSAAGNLVLLNLTGKSNTGLTTPLAVGTTVTDPSLAANLSSFQHWAALS